MIKAANIIISRNNHFIKKVIKLSKDRSYRKETNLAVISGRNLITEAAKSGILEAVLVSELSVEKYESLLSLISINKRYIVDDKIMEKLNLTDTATDIVGLVMVVNRTLDDLDYETDCLILENISDPGNLGTIFRAAGAAKIKTVILTSGCVDPYNSKVLRASAGIQFGLKIFCGINAADFIAKYTGCVIATTPYAHDNLYATDLRSSVAFVFGNEGSGISPELLAKIDTRIKIPMPGSAESLNVAMAATICLFEMVRQRCS